MMQRLSLLALGLAIACQGNAAFATRLFFANKTTGMSGPGPLYALPGDMIEARFYWHELDTVVPYRWTELQVALSFDALHMVSAGDESTWDAFIGLASASGGPSSDFSNAFGVHGTLYDDALNPKNSLQPLMCNNGAYALFDINSAASRAHDWNVMLWRFTVAPAGVGETMYWAFRLRSTTTGLSTRVIGEDNNSYGPGPGDNVADNYVVVVPEPGAAVPALAGLSCLAALCRRKSIAAQTKAAGTAPSNDA